MPDVAEQSSVEVADGADALCVKCGRAVERKDEGSFGKRSRQVIHRWCVATTKLHYRKCKSATFKAWFDEKTREQQQEWYFENGEALRTY